MIKLNLPSINGKDITPYKLQFSQGIELSSERNFNRVIFSAAHVVSNPLKDHSPSLDVSIDWQATLQYRHYLWDLGLGVAEAMDTAQRGMGLTWENSKELIQQSLKEANSRQDKPLIYCGVGTDHITDFEQKNCDDVIRAYEIQMNAVEALGGKLIVMASRLLANCAKNPDDYRYVYNKILKNRQSPVILHWLGEMFDPALEGYWGENKHEDAMKVCLEIIHENKDKIDGIKISLLDDAKEKAMRKLLPSEVKMYTGDDFNYPDLIHGDDDTGYSHALLGIFDAIAPIATNALNQLAKNNNDEYFNLFNPTIALSRHIFQAPTQFYKTGIVFLAYLNGHQNHFQMVNGQQNARSVLHFVELFRLADQANALINPELANQRMKNFLSINAGIIQ